MKEIDHSTLLYLAGEAAYKRGEAYFKKDLVGELRIKGNTIIAEVTGSEIYRVTLKHTARIFEGSCDCPASDNFEFCKHCVATGLKYLTQRQIKDQLYDSKSKDLLKNYLLTLEKTELAEHLEALISNNKLLQDQWMLKAEIAAGKLDHKAFKKRVTKAIPYNRHLYRYAQVRDYFARVDMLVEQLVDLLAEFEPEHAIALIDYALQRINKALETIDDSGGFRYSSVETLNELHIQTLAQIHWPPEKIASYLLSIYSGPDTDLYPPIPDSYLTILADEGMQHFTADLQSQWDELPPLTSKKGAAVDWDTQWQYRCIQRPLLVAAKARGDVDTEITLLVKTAVECRDLLDLSELCLSHDRLDEAINWYQQAQQQDQHEGGHQNYSLAEQEIAILCYQKKFVQALQIRWTRYQQHPNIEGFNRIKHMAAQAGDKNDWYKKALDYLQSDYKQERYINTYDLIVELHLNEQHPERALSIAQQHELDPVLLLDIIRRNTDKPEQVLPLYIRLAEYEVNQGNNNAYHQAIALLQEVEKIINNALRKELFKEITRLHDQYKIKRNFKKWLEEAFPELI